jgi:hypothetical protein
MKDSITNAAKSNTIALTQQLFLIDAHLNDGIVLTTYNGYNFAETGRLIKGKSIYNAC